MVRYGTQQCGNQQLLVLHVTMLHMLTMMLCKVRSMYQYVHTTVWTCTNGTASTTPDHAAYVHLPSGVLYQVATNRRGRTQAKFTEVLRQPGSTCILVPPSPGQFLVHPGTSKNGLLINHDIMHATLPRNWGRPWEHVPYWCSFSVISFSF